MDKTKEKGFSASQRMHPLWMLYLFGKALKDIVILMVLLLLYLGFDAEMKYQTIAVYAAAVYILYKVFSIILEWRNYTYLFSKSEVCINEGKFFKKKRYISLERIQGISQYNTVFHRIFGLTSVVLHTDANRDDSSIKLDMVTYKQLEDINNHILNDTNRHQVVQPTEPKQKTEQIQEEKVKLDVESNGRNLDYKVDPKEIVIASLTSNQVIIFIGLLQTIYFNINDLISVDSYLLKIMSFFEQSWITITIGVIIFLCLAALYGLANTFIKYKHFEVSSDSNRIYIKKGFLTQSMYSIPKEKIQAITFESSFIHRWLNIVEVKTVSANDESDEEFRTSNIVFPFINKEKARHILQDILPHFEVSDEMVRLPKSAIVLKFVRSFLICSVLFAALYYIWPKYWHLYGGVLVLIIISRTLSGFLNHYSINDAHLQFKKGAFFTRLFITKRSKVEEIRVSQSFLQRPFNLASIHILTRANPIKRTVMADVPYNMALDYYEWYSVNSVKKNGVYRNLVEDIK